MVVISTPLATSGDSHSITEILHSNIYCSSQAVFNLYSGTYRQLMHKIMNALDFCFYYYLPGFLSLLKFSLLLVKFLLLLVKFSSLLVKYLLVLVKFSSLLVKFY